MAFLVSLVSSVFSPSKVEPRKKEDAPVVVVSPLEAFNQRLRGCQEMIQAVGKVYEGKIPARFDSGEEADFVAFVESAAQNLVVFEAFYASLQESFSQEIIDAAVAEIPGYSLYVQGYAKLTQEEAQRIKNKCLEIKNTPKDIEPALLHGERFFSELHKDARLIKKWQHARKQVGTYWCSDPSLAVCHFSSHEMRISQEKEDILRAHVQLQTEYSKTLDKILKKKTLIQFRRSLKNEYAFLKLMSSFTLLEMQDRVQFLNVEEAAYFNSMQSKAEDLRVDLHVMMQERQKEILAALEQMKKQLDELNSEIEICHTTFALVLPILKLQLLELDARDLLELVTPIRAINETDLKLKLAGFCKLRHGLTGLTQLIRSLSNHFPADINDRLEKIRVHSPEIAKQIEIEWTKFTESAAKAGDVSLQPLREALIAALQAQRERVSAILTKCHENLQFAVNVVRDIHRQYNCLPDRHPDLMFERPDQLEAALRKVYARVPRALAYLENEMVTKENVKNTDAYSFYPSRPNGNQCIAIKAQDDKLFILEGRKISYDTWRNALDGFGRLTSVAQYFAKGPRTVYFKWNPINREFSSSNRVHGDVMVYPFTPELLQQRKKTIWDWNLYNTANPAHIERLTTAVSLKRVFLKVLQGNIHTLSRNELRELQQALEPVSKRETFTLDPLRHLYEVFSGKFNDMNGCFAEGDKELQEICGAVHTASVCPYNFDKEYDALAAASKWAKRFVEWQQLIEKAIAAGQNSSKYFGQTLRELANIMQGITALIGALPKEFFEEGFDPKPYFGKMGPQRARQTLLAFFQQVVEFHKVNRQPFAWLMIPSLLPKLEAMQQLHLANNPEFQTLLKQISSQFFDELRSIRFFLGKVIKQMLVNPTTMDFMAAYRSLRAWEESVYLIRSETLHDLKRLSHFNTDELIKNFFGSL